MPRYEVPYVQYSGGKSSIPTATVTVKKPDGLEVTEAATGNGPVDAVFKAIQRALGMTIEIQEFSVSALRPGSSAEGRAVARIKHDGVEYEGAGVDTDIIVASARAVVDALNNPVPSDPPIAGYAHIV